MSGKPAARITDPTACPIPGHGTNPIAAGSPDVLFDGLSAARLSDPSACGSPIASAVSPTVFINGLNAATLGSVGAHGNTIIAGSGSVISKDVPAFALVYGNPARVRGFVCKCGKRIASFQKQKDKVIGKCQCGISVEIDSAAYKAFKDMQPKRKIWIR